jgi:hypothetical protein
MRNVLKRLNLDFLKNGGKILRIAEAAIEGSYAFLLDGNPVAWFRRIDSGRWLYFAKTRSLFFDTLSDVIRFADYEFGGA